MGQTVLVVEDDAACREGVAALLRREGYAVVTAADGHEALGRLGGGPAPDLILLDMVIPPPGCDGWRFLERRRGDPVLAAVPVLVTTGLGIASPEWATSLGAVGYLRKPIQEGALLAEVRRCLPG